MYKSSVVVSSFQMMKLVLAQKVTVNLHDVHEFNIQECMFDHLPNWYVSSVCDLGVLPTTLAT